MRPVFFLSDFGAEDPYAGVVRAVILARAPGAPVVDLAHDLPPGDLRRAAYALFQAAPYLPPGAVVLAVVDPGVGSARRAVAVSAGRLFFVAPDNGLLTLALAEAAPREAVLLPVPPGASATFHGRDVFAPAAAALAKGVPLSRLGAPLDPAALVRLPLALGPGPEGEILTFDRFGNAITTLRGPAPPGGRLEVAGHELPCRRTFAEVAPGEALCYLGSAGLLEVAVREGSARDALGLKAGLRVRLLAAESGPGR